MLLGRHRWLGVEFDWLALDEHGQIGYLSTGGAGPVPEVLVKMEPLEELYERVTALPERCSAKCPTDFQHCIDDWITVAKKGIFSYDWRREHGSYVLVAEPGHPLNIDDLKDKRLSDLAKKVILDSLFPALPDSFTSSA